MLWIVVAGYLISLSLDDPVLRSRAYLAKELILVAISSVMFYLLLKWGRSTAIPSDVPRKRLPKSVIADIFFAGNGRAPGQHRHRQGI